MAFNYTVKEGDTKSQLRSKFGIGYSFTGYRSKDPSKLFTGEQLSIPQENIQIKPVIKDDAVDLSKIPEGRKPVPIAPVEAPAPVAQPQFKPMSQDEWLQNLTQTDPERADKIMDSLRYTGRTEERAEPTGTERMSALQLEITDLEQKMSTQQEQKVAGYEETGVFEDMKRLTEMKTNLAKVQEDLYIAQDRGIEIPIETRQTLRGAQATKATFEQVSRPKIEEATLASLAKSREYARLGGAISGFSEAVQSNISMIDAREDAEYERYKFLRDQKVKNLTRLETQHGDIMTNRQKAALSEQKFTQDLFLQDRKAEGEIKKELLTKIIERGGVGSADLTRLSGMTSGQLLDYEFNNSPSNPTNWGELSDDQVMTLDKNTRDNYKLWLERGDQDDKSDTLRKNMEYGMKSTVQKIDDMLADSEGLATSVGLGWGSRDANLFGLGVESAAFRASAKSFIAGGTLNTLKDLKSTGATMGALNKSELGILIDANQDLGAVMNDDGATGRFVMDEPGFKKRLIRIQDAAMRSYAASILNDDTYTSGKFDEMSHDSLRKAYDYLKKNGGPAQQQYNQLQTSQGVSKAMEAIGQIESGGSYTARGPVVQSGMYRGESALGKYQVMPGNLPGWSREAGLNFVPTPDQFLRSPEIQDRIAAAQFLKNYNKYGNWDDVASVWFSGRPMKGNVASDITGTSVPEYIRRFNQYMV